MGSLVLSNSQNLNQSGFSGYGSILTVSRRDADEFPGSFVGALMGITAINVRTNVIPSYHMRSKGRFQSFAPGLRDGGEIAAAVNWLPGANDTQGRYAADWSLLRQATLESNELTRIRVFAPDPDLHLIRVDGFLTQLGPFSYQPEAIMSGQVGWKIVGTPDIITPLVYDVTGAAASLSGKISTVSDVEASESGSQSATIRLGRKNLRLSQDVAGETASAKATRRTAELSLTFAHVVDTSWSVTLGGTDIGDDVPTSPGEGYIRLYIPGVYELWLPAGTNTDDPFITSDAAESTAFAAAYLANGNRCFCAVYGSDDTL